MAPNAHESEPVRAPAAAKPDVLSDEFGFQPEDIVITGFSGRFPECDSIDEMRQKLYAGVDMVTAEPSRWPTGELALNRCRIIYILLYQIWYTYNSYKYDLIFIFIYTRHPRR